MEKEYPNKAMQPEGVKTKAPETQREFFFSGSAEYIPQTVQAVSQEEATAKWEKSRVAVGQKSVEIVTPAVEG